MKDENKNIDTFFSTRLQNKNVENEGWNMPSEDIWNAAKPHFIDRKRKKKRFYLWFLIPFLLMCAVVPYVFNKSLNDKPESASAIVDPNNKNLYQESPQSLAGSNDEVKSELENKTLKQNINEEAETEISQTRIIPEKESDNRNLNVELSESESIKTNAIRNSKSLKINEGSRIGNHGLTQIDNSTSIAFRNSIELGMSDGEVQGLDQNLISSKSKIDKVAPIEHVDLARLSFGSIKKKQIIEDDIQVSLQSPKSIIPITGLPKNFELGITHNQFVVNLVLMLVTEVEEGLDKINLSSDYFNVGISGRKWIADRWSLGTGIQYSNFNLGIDFSIIDTLDRELMQFFNEEFNEIGSRSVIGNQEIDVEINIKDGIDTKIGDILNIQGLTDLKIKAVQIPFILNYHIYRKRMEYLFGMGVAIEYIQLYENPSEFEIFRASELISESVIIPEFHEDYIDGSIYLEAGMRYKIDHRFNVGLNAKVSLLELPFSGFEAGIYYRFN